MTKGTTAEAKVINGVDVSTLENTVNAIQADPSLAKFKFRVDNKWVNGGHNHSIVGKFFGAKQENSHVRAHEMDADEPPVLWEPTSGPIPWSIF